MDAELPEKVLLMTFSVRTLKMAAPLEAELWEKVVLEIVSGPELRMPPPPVAPLPEKVLSVTVDEAVAKLVMPPPTQPKVVQVLTEKMLLVIVSGPKLRMAPPELLVAWLSDIVVLVIVRAPALL